MRVPLGDNFIYNPLKSDPQIAAKIDGALENTAKYFNSDEYLEKERQENFKRASEIAQLMPQVVGSEVGYKRK